MISSRDVISNERMMYKDKHNTTTNELDLRDSVYLKVGYVPKSPTIEIIQLEESHELSFRELSGT